jgi:hypothetical protein
MLGTMSRIIIEFSGDWLNRWSRRLEAQSGQEEMIFRVVPDTDMMQPPHETRTTSGHCLYKCAQAKDSEARC